MKQFGKQFIIGLAMFAILSLAGVAGAQAPTAVPPPGRPLKIVLARNSTVPMVNIMKDLSERCTGISLTTNPERSDYMLYAGGWSGQYAFMVIGKGGDTLYATRTVMLSNAVKDVCKYLSSRPQ